MTAVSASTVEEAAPTGPNVTSGKVASSAIWRITETAGTELISFLVVIWLGRILGPEAFGAVTLADSIMAMLQALLYHGFTESLIQKPDVDARHHNTVLAANFGLAAGLVVLGSLIAWPISWTLGRPEFPAIFIALLPSLMVRGLISPMLASLRRDMDFRSIALRTLLGVLAGGVMAVVLAQRGAGPWSLVAQRWSVELVGFLVLLKASPIKPWAARWNLTALRELTPVAIPVAASAFLSIMSRKLDTLALGFFLPNRAVGIYFMVNRVVFAAQMVTQHGLNEVALVVLSNMSQDEARYRRGLYRAMRLMSYVCALAFGLLAVAGPWLLPIAFGAQWHAGIAPLRVLATLSVGGAVASIAGVILVASGYASAFSRLQIGSAFLQLVGVAITAHWGLMAVAWAVGIAQCLTVLPALGLLTKNYKVSWASLFAEIAPVLSLFGLGLLAAHEVRELGDAWYLQLLAASAFVLVMGVGALWLLYKERVEKRELAAEAAAAAAVPPPSPTLSA